ncbi:hypothetical protein, partial [Yersinia pestis]|uniref:hypothetical protein n=1 Tax=Yersinia pestis TaxID=632 RepID=UPI001EE6449A
LIDMCVRVDRESEQCQSQGCFLHATTPWITPNAESNNSTTASALIIALLTGASALWITPVKMQSSTKAIEIISNKVSNTVFMIGKY